MQMARSEGKVCEMGGKIVSQTNLALQAWAGCLSGLWQQGELVLCPPQPHPLSGGGLWHPPAHGCAWCVNASLCFKFVLAQLAGLTRQMGKELGNKKERRKTHLHRTWTSTCTQPCSMSLQSYPNRLK